MWNFLQRPTVLRYSQAYTRFFSINEIKESRTLQLLTGALLLYFVVTYTTWVHATTTNPVCWPYFQGCTNFAFLFHPGVVHDSIAIALFALLLAAAYAIWKQLWTIAHACILILFLWKAGVGFLLNFDLLGVYDYYHLILTAVALLFPHKEFFAKAAFVLLYFLSATIKFHPTWVLGTYFSALSTGLPFVPDILTPIATNIVIFSQVIGCWFLMSYRPIVQRTAFVFFEAFHFYSIAFVGYSYPLITIPIIAILFGPLYRHQLPPLTRRSFAGWVFLMALVLIQLYTFFIPGDQKMTLEGYRYGIWMFDANHQCVASVTSRYPAKTKGFRVGTWSARPESPCVGYACLTKRSVEHTNDQWVVTDRWESPKSWSRCSPYRFHALYQSACKAGGSVALQFDHSINGGPFYRIVDETNICALSYAPFWHNEWIKEPPEAPAIGVPVTNEYSEFVD